MMVWWFSAIQERSDDFLNTRLQNRVKNASCLLCMAFIIGGCETARDDNSNTGSSIYVKESLSDNNVSKENITYRAAFQNVNWEAEMFSCGCIHDNMISLVGFKNIAREDDSQRLRRQYVLYNKSFDTGAEHTIELEIQDNLNIISVTRNSTNIYLYAKAMATRENPNPKDIYVIKCSEEGVIENTIMFELSNEDNSEMVSMQIDSNENIWFSNLTRQEIVEYSSEGTIQKKINVQGNQIHALFEANGNIFAESYDTNGNWNSWTINDDGIENDCCIPQSNNSNQVCPGQSETYLLREGNEIWRYDTESESKNKICSMSEIGIDSKSVYSFTETSNKNMVMLLGMQGQPELTIVYLKKEEISIDQEKNTLVIACLEADDLLNDTVAAYNRSGHEYIVKIKEYFDPYQSDASKEDALKLLNADLTDGDAGDMLDFVSVQEYMTRTQYTKLGLFEDINSWIDADKSIERNDYTQSLWEANEISESLYNFVPFYNLNTKIGSEDALNDYTNMTIEQFLTVEDPVSIFGSYYVREDFWHDVCVFWISQSDFEKSLIMDEQLLQKMLDFAKELPYVRNDMSDIFNNHEMYF